MFLYGQCKLLLLNFREGTINWGEGRERVNYGMYLCLVI